jgi:outer membrane PBP1 activator LpoA protein
MRLFKIIKFLLALIIIGYIIGCTSSEYIATESDNLEINTEVKLPEISLNLPRKIAIILPLSQNAQVSGAILSGFLSNYFNYHDREKVEIYVLDSSNGMENIANDILTIGVDFIVGPLLRENVSELDKTINATPTLYLNYPFDDATNLNAYFFGLRPEDEIASILSYVESKKINNITIFSPLSEYGRRLEIALETVIRNSSLNEIALINYEQNATSYLNTINDSFLITESNARRNRLANNLRIEIDSNPRRRQDIDAIIAFGTRDNLESLIPQIRFSFANDMDIFLLSDIRTINDNSVESSDFDRVIFTDSPFFSEKNNFLFSSNDISTESSKFNTGGTPTLQRLFAFGKDAFNLVGLINTEYFSYYNDYNGYTGKIIIGENNYFTRKPLLFQFIDNDVVEVNNP